jgi:hypothetical protein
VVQVGSAETCVHSRVRNPVCRVDALVCRSAAPPAVRIAHASVAVCVHIVQARAMASSPQQLCRRQRSRALHPPPPPSPSHAAIVGPDWPCLTCTYSLMAVPSAVFLALV